MSNINNSVNIKVTAHGAKEVTKDLKSIADSASIAAKSVNRLVHELFEINKARSVFSGLKQDTRAVTLDLQQMSRSAGMTSQHMEKMSKGASNAAKGTKNLGKAAKTASIGTNSLLKSIRGMLGFGFGIVFIKKIANEVINYSKSITSLSAALETNAGAAGKSLSSLADSATKLGDATGTSVVKIRNLQAQLLSFKNVSGDTFDRAIKGALDMSAKFGIDATSAARALGKALNEPGKSLESLTSIGVKFTTAEIEVLKAMTAVGREADVQALIFGRLEKSVGGAAEASKTYVSNLVKAKDYLVSLTAAGISGFFDLPVVGAKISYLKDQLKEANEELEEIEATGGNNTAIQEQMLIRERINVSLAQQIVFQNRLRQKDAETQAAAEMNLQQAMKNVKNLEKECDVRKSIADGSKKANEEAEKALAIDVKRTAEAKKLNEGTKELIDSLGLMNDKSKKFLQTMVSVGKILGGLGATDAGNMFGSIGKLFGFAKGGAFGKGGVQYMAKGGILNSPTAFGTSSGMAVAGEAGPEAVLPLSRGPGGKLGVEGSAANVNVQVIDQRSSGAAVSVEQDSSGVKITIRDEVKNMFSSGQMDGVMSQQFALNRQGSY